MTSDRHTEAGFSIRKLASADSMSGLEKTTQHIGSKPRGPTSPSMISGDSGQDTKDAVPETPNPCSRKGYDASCLYLAASGMEAASVEAAGIEPASRDVSMKASTCVADSLVFAEPPPVDRVRT